MSETTVDVDWCCLEYSLIGFFLAILARLLNLAVAMIMLMLLSASATDAVGFIDAFVIRDSCVEVTWVVQMVSGSSRRVSLNDFTSVCLSSAEE